MTTKSATEPQLFYRMSIYFTESGHSIDTQVYRTVHETACFHFVICTYDYTYLTRAYPDQCTYKLAIKFKFKVRRIHKLTSRVAFPTEKEAFNNLKFRTGWRIRFLQGTLKAVQEAFKQMDKLTYKQYTDQRERRFQIV